MSIYINFGYTFDLLSEIKPEGGILLASTMPEHQLIRRKGLDKKVYLKNRLFDPQLYMAGLDPNQSKKFCVNLASYPWFKINGVSEYKSSQTSQAAWKNNLQKRISSIWTGRPLSEVDDIEMAVRDCIDFQIELGCSEIILPSPLTVDPGTDYSLELLWLDAAIDYLSAINLQKPYYATIALADVCVRYQDPNQNSLLGLILDSISARGVKGVYLIFEQGSENNETRYCGNTRALWSALYITYLFKNDCNIDTLVNFFGPFGLILRAIGAKSWSTGWYKSLVRFRIADKAAGGRAFPSFWSTKGAIDINLESDFDLLIGKGYQNEILSVTTASEGLHRACLNGVTVNNVPDWRYAMSNIGASRDHFLLSMVQLENEINDLNPAERLKYINDWLMYAIKINDKLEKNLPKSKKTKLDHVKPWFEAFQRFRLDQNL